MASKLDLALDEVIRERRKETRGKRDNNNNNNNNNNNRNNGNRSDFGSRRNRDGGIRKRNNDNGTASFAARSFTRSVQVPNRRNVDGQWSHDKFKEEESSSPSSIHSRLGARPLSGRIGSGGGNNMELSVENLHYDVTEKDLQELFSSVGDVQKARITFDPSGRSTGCAFVKYVNIEDAKKALEKFNDVLFDGQPMRIELKERERPESRGNNRGGRNNNNSNNRRNGSGNGNGNGNGGRSFRGGRSRNNQSGGGRDSRDKQNVTAEDLDREMESYMSSNNNDNDMILD